MNKKLQNGLVVAVSAAMGTGIVAPVIAAAATTGTNLDAQYAEAYNATVKATASKDQKDLTAARVLVDGLYQAVKGTKAEYLATTLSSLLDPAQQVKLNDLYTAMAKADASLKQADINASRDLLLAMPQQWVKTFSSANDAIQQKLISKVNDAVVKAEGSKLAADKTAAQALVDDVKTATNNADVLSWANSMATRLGAVVTEVKVNSVSAINATNFKVVFNQAPADTTKVVFAVSQSGAKVDVTATWNAAKTEATLTKSSNFTVGSYSVNVKNDATDLGTSTVAVTEQKVAKIQINSTKLGVVTDPKTSVQTGYATYQVLDQYGVDVTNSAIANNVQFQTGVGTITASKGLIKITPTSGLNLMTFASGIVITGTDSNTGVSTSATLTATSQIGTLSDISLTTLTNADGKVLTAGNTTDIFYAGFSALDISGNATTNYTLLKQGLMLNADGYFTTSNPNVTAQLVQDPTDSTKGLIEVRATAESITVDMPVVITAMTWTGKTSQINTTLKKQGAVDVFTLQVPNDSIASGESNVIPFTAFDQNGKQLTKAVDLAGVQFTNIDQSTDINGNLVLKNKAVTVPSGATSIPEVLSAMTPTSKYSSITINIQKAVTADALSLDTSVLKPIMQQATTGTTNGASQKADFGYSAGGLNVKDQYGRAIDMTTADTAGTAAKYQVVATSSNTSVISVSGYAGVGQHQIAVKAGAPGSATVRFDLIDTTNNSVVIDSKSETFTVLADADIKDYAIDSVANAIYAVNDASTPALAAVTAQEYAYKANPKVYGTTSTGAKVVLRGTPILGVTVDNPTDFKVVYTKAADATTVVYDGAPIGVDAGYKNVKVVANKLSGTKTESSTKLSVTLMGADNAVHVVNTVIKSSTAAPVASSMDVSCDTSVAGISRDGDVITLKPTGTDTFATLLGDTLAEYELNGTPASVGNIYFAPVDQYGKDASYLAHFITVASGTKVTGTFSVDDNGIISGVANSGDYITITGVTTSGLAKTIKIVFGTASTGGGSGSGSGTGSSAAATALAAVNNATDVASMQAALVNVNLGLTATEVAAYNSLLPINKNVVAQHLLDNLATNGAYTTVNASVGTHDLQTVLDAEPAMIAATTKINDAAKTTADKNALAITFSGTDTATGVTGNLTLPATGAQGSTITWSSDTPAVVANTGVVTRPTTTNTTVVLTATITSGTSTVTKTFTLTVLK